MIEPKFDVGDYVFVRNPHNKGHKLDFKWIGPKKITAVVNHLVYEMRSVTTDSIKKVHCTRLMPYRKIDKNMKASPELQRMEEHAEATYEEIGIFFDISNGAEGIMIQTKCLGFPDDCSFTWQNINRPFEDAPELLKNYLESCKKRRLVNITKRQLGLD